MTPVAQRPLDEVQLPFVMELARPGKMRFELEFAGQTAIQVFDGANGWKLRPFLGRRVVEPYTTDEMKAASLQADRRRIEQAERPFAGSGGQRDGHSPTGSQAKGIQKRR